MDFGLLVVLGPGVPVVFQGYLIVVVNEVHMGIQKFENELFYIIHIKFINSFLCIVLLSVTHT